MTGGDVVRLYGAFQRRLEQMVRCGVLAPEAVIEDACQAAWADLIRHRQRIELQGAPGWLLRTAIHEALRLLSLEGREDPLELALQSAESRPGGGAPGPEDQFWQRERIQSLRALSPRQQRLVWLRAMGLSCEEMARHERCTSRTVRRQLDRARRSLQALDRPAVSAAA